MLLPCKSLTYNTVYRSESVVVVVVVIIVIAIFVVAIVIVVVVIVVVVIVVIVVKMGIKLRNPEMMITRLTTQDTNYTELSFCKIVYSYVKYPQIFFIQVYMVNQN